MKQVQGGKILARSLLNILCRKDLVCCLFYLVLQISSLSVDTNTYRTPLRIQVLCEAPEAQEGASAEPRLPKAHSLTAKSVIID